MILEYSTPIVTIERFETTNYDKIIRINKIIKGFPIIQFLCQCRCILPLFDDPISAAPILCCVLWFRREDAFFVPNEERQP
jgi:hypothetical protein